LYENLVDLWRWFGFWSVCHAYKTDSTDTV